MVNQWKLTSLIDRPLPTQPVLPVPSADLSGKTIVVVGGNAGLGYEAAKHYCAMNPGKLILACRNEERTNTALASLVEDTGFEQIVIREVDLSSYASVKNLAEQLTACEERLDILIANAGYVESSSTEEYIATEDEWESILQVNHMSLALLGLLLLPKMLRTAEEFNTYTRTVVVGSDAYVGVMFPKELVESQYPLKTLSSKGCCTPEVLEKRFAETKLLNLLFVRALTSCLPPTSPLILTCANPGFCSSDHSSSAAPSARDSIISNASTGSNGSAGEPTSPRKRSSRSSIADFSGWVATRVRETLFARTPEEGSRQIVFASLDNVGLDNIGLSANGFGTTSTISSEIILEDNRSETEGVVVSDANASEHSSSLNLPASSSDPKHNSMILPVQDDEAKATEGRLNALRGAYISDNKVTEPSEYVLSEDGKRAENRFWDDLVKELTVIEPKVLDVVVRYLAEPVDFE